MIPPIKTYDEAHTENQTKIAEIIKAGWDAGYKQGLKDGGAK